MNQRQLLIGVVLLALVALGAATYFIVGRSPPAEDVATAADTQAIPVTSDDRTLGSPKAPVTIIEYASPMCPHCAHFDMDVFPLLKQRYIETGKVYFVFRVFPFGPVDVAAEAMARCLPRDQYFQFLDLLYRNQPKWDPDGYAIPDEHAALVDMGKMAGISPEETDACISNQVAAQKIQDVGAIAQVKYGIHQTPSFLVNGQLENFHDFEGVQAYLDPLLAKK